MPFRKIRTYLFDIFHFNKQERNGVFILCIIITLLFIIRLTIPYLQKSDDVTILSDVPKTQASEFNPQEENSHEQNIVSKISIERFVFNPNTITEEDAQKLGFSKKLSSTLIKFRSKGGKFYKAEDLKKLYGLSPQLYNELENYILIPNAKNNFKHDSVYTTQPRYQKKTFTKELLEINSADSLSLVYLKGIGPGFTKRILKYRNLLGGFHNISQLKEVYGMTDSTFTLLNSQIKLNETAITKIPINSIDFNLLKKHPYFNFQSAQAIINYRTKHGKITESDIKSLGIFNDEKLKLILPYLSYQ